MSTDWDNPFVKHIMRENPAYFCPERIVSAMQSGNWVEAQDILRRWAVVQIPFDHLMKLMADCEVCLEEIKAYLQIGQPDLAQAALDQWHRDHVYYTRHPAELDALILRANTNARVATVRRMAIQPSISTDRQLSPRAQQLLSDLLQVLLEDGETVLPRSFPRGQRLLQA
jgi:outer membrane protein assembly factor BamD (BamD/ComL family)